MRARGAWALVDGRGTWTVELARLLDECAAIPGLEGMMLAFDDFTTGPNLFGERIQPLMRSRAHLGR